MYRTIIMSLLLLAALFPSIASAYVIPHPKEREGRRNPRIEIIQTTTGTPLRSSRGTLFFRSLPNAPDERLKKPSRRNISRLQKARTSRIRIEQSKAHRRPSRR